MIKFTTEPKRLIDMIDKALIHSYLPQIVATISETGIELTDKSKSVVGSFTRFPKNYFKEYEVDEQVRVLFKKEFIDGLSNLGFGSQDSITVEVDQEANCLKVSAGTKKWAPTLFELPKNSDKTNLPETMVSMKVIEVPGIGILPQSAKLPMTAQYKIAITKLKAPKVAKVTLRIGESTLAMELDYDGPFQEMLTIIESRKLDEPGAYTFFIEYLEKILGCFTGEIWITQYPNSTFFTQTTDDHALMYFMSVT